MNIHFFCTLFYFIKAQTFRVFSASLYKHRMYLSPLYLSDANLCFYIILICTGDLTGGGVFFLLLQPIKIFNMTESASW